MLRARSRHLFGFGGFVNRLSKKQLFLAGGALAVAVAVQDAASSGQRIPIVTEPVKEG